MRRMIHQLLFAGATVAGFSLALMGNGSAISLYAKEKVPAVSPDDPTLRLYQVLDSTRGGKLADFYVLADVYKDPKTDQEFQRVLRVEYNKDAAFGKLRVYVRNVAKLTPAQLKTYTAQQVYEFGETDSEKFTKTDAGPFGKTGDLYFRAGENMPLATMPITEEVKKTYEMLVTQFLLPALEKK